MPPGSGGPEMTSRFRSCSFPVKQRCRTLEQLKRPIHLLLRRPDKLPRRKHRDKETDSMYNCQDIWPPWYLRIRSHRLEGLIPTDFQRKYRLGHSTRKLSPTPMATTGTKYEASFFRLDQHASAWYLSKVTIGSGESCMQLCGFSYASGKDYAAAVYLKATSNGSTVGISCSEGKSCICCRIDYPTTRIADSRHPVAIDQKRKRGSE